jgi:hypothetical protein
LYDFSFSTGSKKTSTTIEIGDEDMTQIGIETKEFNTRYCLAKQRTDEVSDCLSSADVFIFCPFVLFFGGGQFCRYPQRDEIITRTQIQLKDIRGE